MNNRRRIIIVTALIAAVVVAVLATDVEERPRPAGATSGATSGAMAVDCNASVAGIQSNCIYSTGEQFRIQVYATTAPTVGYYAFQTKLRWNDARLDYLPAPAATDEGLWPDCVIAARFDNQTNEPLDPSMVFSCTPAPLSTPDLFFVGAILIFQFQCQQDGSSSLDLVPREVDNQLGSHFLDENIDFVDPLLTNATVECAAPTATPDPDLDSDGDGCTNAQELGSNAASGGQRDPDYFWDFFDTPNTSNVRDRSINAADITRVVNRFGTNGTATTVGDALSAPPASGYHAAFDRSASSSQFLGPADGVISAGDITFVVLQFGHTCL